MRESIILCRVDESIVWQAPSAYHFTGKMDADCSSNPLADPDHFRDLFFTNRQELFVDSKTSE
jgi:hypothetical protein